MNFRGSQTCSPERTKSLDITMVRPNWKPWAEGPGQTGHLWEGTHSRHTVTRSYSPLWTECLLRTNWPLSSYWKDQIYKTSLNPRQVVLSQCFKAVSGSADTLTAQWMTETHRPDAAWRWLTLITHGELGVSLHWDHREASVPSPDLSGSQGTLLVQPKVFPEGERTKTLSSRIYNP